MFLHLRCVVLEKGGKLPLSLMSLFKGSLTAFLLWKVCTVKKGQSKTLQSVCREWCPVCALIQDTAPTHPCTAHTELLWNQRTRNWRCTPWGRMWLPARQLQVKVQPFPKCQMGWTLPNTGHALGSLGGRWAGLWQCPCAGHQSLASSAHEGHKGTALSVRTSWKRRTEPSTIPWNVDWEGCVSLEINFHQNVPPNDWQLHPRTQHSL